MFSYEVYFQPHIAYDNPDIVILREGGGVVIIEVKDYQLDLYQYRNDKLTLTTNGQETVDPFPQVWGYRNKLLESFPDFYESNLLNPDKMQFVYSGVFYSTVSSQQIQSVYGEAKDEGRYIFDPLTRKKDGYIRFWGSDTINDICSWIKNSLRSKSKFSTDIYNKIHRFFLPSREIEEQSIPLIIEDENLIILSNCMLRKDEFSQNEKRAKRYSVTGAAGSGKTLMLARKAVECYSFRKEPVLILTYNVTLRHYLEDKIALVGRGKLSRKQIRDNFDVIHFDAFLSASLKKMNIVAPPRKKTEEDEDYNPDDYELWRQECFSLLEKNKGEIKRKYTTILIDEGQDFNTSWIQMVYNLFFVKSNGEMVLAWDRKQKIYEERALEPEELINIFPNIVEDSPRYALTGGKRFDPRIVEFANKFQETFLSNKHGESVLCNTQLTINDNLGLPEIRYLSMTSESETFENEFIQAFDRIVGKEDPTSPNDIGIVCSKIETLRHIEEKLRKILKTDTATTFEQEETYQRLLNFYNVNQSGITGEEKKKRKKNVKEECDRLRRIKKDAFRMNPGVTKMSTIHSFKGWEIDTLFVIVDPRDSYEMIYTAITRAKRRLFICTSYSNPVVNKFFADNADTFEMIREDTLPF